jgi:hypothetical protein
MSLKKPQGWRFGQTMFNFFEWLKTEKGMTNIQSSRMADPFLLSDKEFFELYEEFKKTIK